MKPHSLPGSLLCVTDSESATQNLSARIAQVRNWGYIITNHKGSIKFRVRMFLQKIWPKSNKRKYERWDSSKGELGKNNFHVHKEQPPQNTCTYALHMVMYCLKINSSMCFSKEKQHYIEHSSSEKGEIILLAKLSTGLPVEHAQRRKHNLGVRTSGTTWIPALSLVNWLLDGDTFMKKWWERCYEPLKSSSNTMKWFTSRQERKRDWIWNIWTIWNKRLESKRNQTFFTVGW